MTAVKRVARAYYQANVAAWRSLRRSPAATMAALVAVYLGMALALNFSGHTVAAWVVTAVFGLPLLVVGWRA